MTDELSKGFLYGVIAKLAPDPKKVREWVREIRHENPGIARQDLAVYVSDYLTWQYSAQGATLALPGAIPGLGTIVQISTELTTVSADVALMIRNQTYLVFALGECYGIKGRETLLQDALICMGLWTNALSLTKNGAIRVGTKIAAANFKKRFPATIFKAINQRVGTTIVTKYGTKRGGVAVGKLIPFGVGVLVGGGFNYITMKRFSSASRNYLSLKVKR